MRLLIVLVAALALVAFAEQVRVRLPFDRHLSRFTVS